MNFLKSIFKPKNNAPEQTETLQEWMDSNNIIYEIDEADVGYKIIYFDVFDKIKFEIIFDGNRYIINGAYKDQDDIKELLKTQQTIDSGLEEYMYNPENYSLIQVYEFVKSTFSNGEVSYELIINKQNELILYCNHKSKDKSIPLIKIDKDSKRLYDIKNNHKVNSNEAVISVVNQTINCQPLLFATDELKIPADSPFADIVKQYLLNKSLVERLNKTKNIEAKMINAKGNCTIFIIYKNGSALEYISPTKQSPGHFFIMDVDEDNTLEDNEEYWISKKILKMPDLLSGKPDEGNLPIRKLGNKKSLRLE